MGSEVRFTFWGGEGATEDMAGRLQQREGSMASSQRQLQVGSGGRGCVDQSWGAGHSWSPVFSHFSKWAGQGMASPKGP